MCRVGGLSPSKEGVVGGCLERGSGDRPVPRGQSKHERGVPETVHARHGCSAASTGKGCCVVLSFGFVLSCRAPLRMHLFGAARDHNGHKGHVQDHEVGANCIVLSIVRCLWEGGVCAIFLGKVFALVRDRLGRD